MGQNDQPKGYHRLAALMSRDSNFAIFRRFDESNALCLLYLQAEIMDLEADLRNQCQADDQASGPEHDFTTRFTKLRETGVGSDQYLLLAELTSKVKLYNEMILQVSQIATVPKANPFQLDMLQDWLRDSLGGNKFLQSTEASTWEPGLGTTFVNVGSDKSEGDIFSGFVSWLMTTEFIRRLFARAGTIIDERSQLKSFSDSKIHRFCTVLTTILASVFPVISILVLYFIKNPLIRIGLTIVFTGVFAAVLSVFSRARRVEVFATTAAFAAVEVVFIGSALP